MQFSNTHDRQDKLYGTTILTVRIGKKVAIAGDGQVTLGQTVIKSSARKIRRLADDKIIAGFAGVTADAFTLFERLESKLEKHPGQLLRACVDLTKDWRTDKYLRNLEALMIVIDKENSLVLTGQGDVLEPEDGIAAIGSGGNYAAAAAKAIVKTSPNMEPIEIVRIAMQIAADICIYTNHNIVTELLEE